jgi:hypothetical protein
MAQLPAIGRDGPLPITSERFFEVASRFLSASDLATLTGLVLEPPREDGPITSDIILRWYSFERSLRLSLARIRAQRLSRDDLATGDDESKIYAALDVQQVARAASSIDNPLEAELFLLKARLDFIDLAGALHHFDAEAVFAYGLSLLLRERGIRFAREAGRSAYGAIYNRILGE